MIHIDSSQGLPDYFAKNLKILFVGYNPGERAAALGHHYAGRGNQFWKLLNESGLTQRLYRPEEDGLLLLEGYGLTNLVGRPSKSSSDLSAAEMREGAEELRRKVAFYRPSWLCLVGKEVYRQYAKLKTGTMVEYGKIPDDSYIYEGIKEFVAPNPSGRNAIPYAEKLSVFSKLREIAF